MRCIRFVEAVSSEAEVSWHQARRRLQEPGTRELASTGGSLRANGLPSADSPTRLRLGREARWHGSAPAPRSRSEPRVREESSASAARRASKMSQAMFLGAAAFSG